MGLNIDGSANAKVTVKGARVRVELKASVKITAKVLGRKKTLLSQSDSWSVSKNLKDLKPCADVRRKSGRIIVVGKICIVGNRVCFKDGKLLVDFQGEHKVADIPQVCVGIG
jgi:hypothetical protein